MADVYAVDVRNSVIDPDINGTLQGDSDHNLHCHNVVMVANSSGSDIAGSLDASYYKGAGSGCRSRKGVHRDSSK